MSGLDVPNYFKDFLWLASPHVCLCGVFLGWVFFFFLLPLLLLVGNIVVKGFSNWRFYFLAVVCELARHIDRAANFLRSHNRPLWILMRLISKYLR